MRADGGGSGVDARQQLVGHERLGDEVIRPSLETRALGGGIGWR